MWHKHTLLWRYLFFREMKNSSTSSLGSINNLPTRGYKCHATHWYGAECHVIDRSDRSMQSGFSNHFLSLWLEASDIFSCLCSSLHTCSGKQLLMLSFQCVAMITVLLWDPRKNFNQSWPIITVCLQMQLLHRLHFYSSPVFSVVLKFLMLQSLSAEVVPLAEKT